MQEHTNYVEGSPEHNEALEAMIAAIQREREVITAVQAQRARKKQGGAVKARKRLRKQAQTSRRKNRG